MALEDAHWFVAMTLPNSEPAVVRRLAALEFLTFAPRTPSQRAGHYHFLFPGYVFVALRDGWQAVQRTFGIRKVLLVDHLRPALCPPDWIRLMRLAVDQDQVIKLPEREEFALGANVTIELGPFAGYHGFYAGQTVQQRHNILLNILGGDTVVNMERTAFNAV